GLMAVVFLPSGAPRARGSVPEIHVHKAGVGAVPAQGDGAGLAVAVLGHDALGGVGVHIGPVGLLAGVVGVPVQEQHAVGVLLDGARVAQVGQLGPVAGVVALFFHRAGKLTQGNDGHIHLLGHDLEVAGDGADLLDPVFAALARGHQLQVVDDDQADVGPAGVLVDPADLGLHLGDGDGRGIVHIDGGVVELFGGQGQVLPVGGGQRAGAESLAVDARLGREDAVGQLL